MPMAMAMAMRYAYVMAMPWLWRLWLRMGDNTSFLRKTLIYQQLSPDKLNVQTARDQYGVLTLHQMHE